MSDQMNLRKRIELYARGKPIEAAIVTHDGDEKSPNRVPEHLLGEVVSWNQAKEWLDYEFERYYGYTPHYEVIAWTASRVIFTGMYDGNPYVTYKPRNPTPQHRPKRKSRQ